jgi:hypothetical protein
MNIQHVHENADSGSALSAHRLRPGSDLQHFTVGWRDGYTFLPGHYSFRIPEKMDNTQGHDQSCQAWQGPFQKGKDQGDQYSHANIRHAFQTYSNSWTPHGNSPS